MAVVRVPTSKITDWESFHDVFAQALQFADYYGRNKDAFDDMLYYPHPPDVGAGVGEGDTLILYLDEPGDAFSARCPEQHAFLVDALGRANAEGIERGAWITLALAFR